MESCGSMDVAWFAGKIANFFEVHFFGLLYPTETTTLLLKKTCLAATWPHPYMQFHRIGHDHHEGISFEGTSYSSCLFLQSTSYSYPDDKNHNKSLVQTSRLFGTRYQRLIPKAVQEKAISASSPSQLPDPMDFDMTNALQLFMLKTHSC